MSPARLLPLSPVRTLPRIAGEDAHKDELLSNDKSKKFKSSKTTMQIFCFHLMPWAYLPEDFFKTHQSAWVSCSNTFYDPELGYPLYNRYLDELELADELGFDGVCVNEHHQTAYGGMPSP
jgi:hypothetical protein